MSEPVKKQAIQTFTIDYWNPDGSWKSSDIVRPVPFMGTDGRPGQAEMIAAQEAIIEYVVMKTAAIGAMAIDPEGLNLLKTAANMLLVMGKSESARGIDLRNLLESGDYLQIARIFVSKSYSDAQIITPFEQPSCIAEIHKMNFWGKFYAAQEIKAKQATQIEIAKIEEMVMPAEIVPVPVTKINTPPALAAAGI